MENQSGSKLGWLLAGALAGYLFDGAAGRRRRRRLSQKLRSLERRAENDLGRGLRDLGNRAHGAAAELSAGLRIDHPSDEVIAGRVRARIGRLVTHPHAVRTQVHDGLVLLSGAVREGERAQLLEGVALVRGVRGVESQVDESEEGPARPRGRESLLGGIGVRWSPGLRLLVGAAGGGLAGWAGRRGHRTLELAGLAAAARAFIGGGRSDIQLHKTLHVAAPVEAVFHYFSDFENFPRFMSHIREVHVLDSTRSHWVVDGPADVPVEWDARVTALDPNRLVAWRTEEASVVRHQGQVRFFPEDGGTRMEIRLLYHPPAGSLGHAVATLFGRDPKREMDDDLLRFKSLLEEGKARGREGAVNRQDLLH